MGKKGAHMKGGKAAAAGAHGCIFSPPLACVSKGRTPNTVSKLMIRRKAYDEFTESALPRVMLERMDPVLRNFFIVPEDPPCHAAPLTPDDLIDSRRVCRNFPDEVRRDVNAHLDKLRILAQADGGVEVRGVLPSNFVAVAPALSALLGAIREMNLRGVIHGDVKSANIVFNSADGVARLIDWGFCRPLQNDYCNKTWEDWGAGVFMSNCIPSMWAYTRFETTPVDPRKYAEFAHAALEAMAATNAGHLNYTDRMFTACNAVLRAYNLTPITYPAPLTASGAKLHPLRGVSTETTNILVAHAVAVMQQWGQSKTRFCQLVDLVLRANLDVYGVLNAFGALAFDTRTPSRDMVVIAVAPYLMSVEYAVRPYDVRELQKVIAELQASWTSPTLKRSRGPALMEQVRAIIFPAKAAKPKVVQALDVEAAVRLVDPSRLRVFPYFDFEGGGGKTVAVRYTPEQVEEQVRLGCERLRRWTSLMVPIAPAARNAAHADDEDEEEIIVDIETPYFTPKETWAQVEQVEKPVSKKPRLNGSMLSGGVILALQ